MSTMRFLSLTSGVIFLVAIFYVIATNINHVLTTTVERVQPTYEVISEAQESGSGCIKVDGCADKIVCVCDAQTCDDLSFDWPQDSGKATLVESTQNGLRFKSTKLTNDRSSSSDQQASITIKLNSRRQQILGWGGAFTDAAALNIKSLSEALEKRLLASYFGEHGLQYNFARVPIGGSDFSTRAYSYDDSPPNGHDDLNLTNWKLADEDIKYKIPLIQEAQKLVSSRGGRGGGDKVLKLVGSPWSPPRWMKANNDFRRGHLIDSDEIYASYAQYLINFFKAYREHSIEFWGATVQNEPISAYLPFYFFNSLQMTSSETIKFVGSFLGPALEKFGKTKENFKLMIGDDSLGLLDGLVPKVMQDKQVQRYISGLAFHWYLSNLLVSYDSLTHLLSATNGTGLEFVMMSEACNGAFPSLDHVALGDWSRGESYAHDIIEDLKRQTGAWIDWNLALDMKGGPNWSGNFADSPIIVDASKDLFYKQPMYYALAHFSRLLQPGSYVVDTESSGSRHELKGVTFIGAHKADTGHVILTVLNKSNKKRAFSLRVQQGAPAAANETETRTISERIQLEPKSLSSVVVKL